MADEKSTGVSDASSPPTRKTSAPRRRYFRHVLELHPAVIYTRAELLVELSGGGAPGYLGFDVIERAVRELVGCGAAFHRIGEDEMVRPTRAVLRCWDLTEGAS